MTRPPFSILSIASANALSVLGDATMYAVLPTYYVHIGLTPLQVGILLSVNRWIRLASNRLAERCYRNSPVELWLIPAFLLSSAVTAIYGSFRVFTILFAARILWGICFSFIRQAGIMTVVSASSDAHLGEHMGLYRGISSSGWFLGMFLAGLSHDLFGFTSTLITFSLITLISAPLGFLSQRGLDPLKTASLKTTIVKTNLGMMLCGFALGIVGVGLIMSTLGLILKEQIGVSMNLFGHAIGVATITGAVLAVRWVLVGIGSPVLGAIADRIGRERSVPVLFVGGTIVLGLATCPFGPLWMVGLVLIVFLCETLLDTLISARAGQQGARYVASYVTAFDCGSALGPLLGWSIVHFDLPTNLIFLIGAIFYTLGVFVSNRALA
jgi:MFS family permease